MKTQRRRQRTARRLQPALLFGATSLALACGEPTPESIGPEGTDGNVSGTEGYDPGETETEGEGASAGAFAGCLRFPKDDEWAVQHQCGGSANVLAHFEVVGAGQHNGDHSYSFSFGFGDNHDDETYEKPKVMACCQPFDEELPVEDQPQVHSCYHDLIENGCRSLVPQLLALKDHPDFPGAAGPQVNSLADWIAEHQQECYSAFWHQSGGEEWQPENEFDTFPEHTWHLPGSANTLNLKNIRLELPFAWIWEAALPEDPDDWLTCTSQYENNDVHFLGTSPDPANTFGLQAGKVGIDGELEREPVVAFATLASAATGCPDCSYLSHDIAAKRMVDALVLDSEPVARVEGSVLPWGDIDRFRIALFSAVDARQVTRDRYSVATGTAHFTLSALDGDDALLLSAYNSRPIELERITIGGSTRWHLRPFELQYTDIADTVWTLWVDELVFE